MSPTTSFLDRARPIVCAPMAGASTPELAAAVSASGGLGFLAAGYLNAESMAAEVRSYRDLADAPVAINLFTPQVDRSLELAPRIEAYRGALGARAGEPRWDDDDFDAKVEWLIAHPVDAVSFTFGPVPRDVVTELRAVGTQVGFTVTSAHEARQAVVLGGDFLVAQGATAGGHRGTWNVSDEPNELLTLDVAQEVAFTGLPVIAAGGVGTSSDVAALLDAGAVAVACGTAFLGCEESKASPAHKAALSSGEFPSASVTRAFSGRFARALVNDFVREYDGQAPSAYPNVHHMTRPLRTAAAATGDPQRLALWAGAGARHQPSLARDVIDVLDPSR